MQWTVDGIVSSFIQLHPLKAYAFKFSIYGISTSVTSESPIYRLCASANGLDNEFAKEMLQKDATL